MTTIKHRWTVESGHDACTCGVRGGMGYLSDHLIDVGRESAKGELVTLDDPRVREGARLRLEWPDKDSDEWEAVEGRARDLHPFPNSDRGPELTVASRSVTTARRFVTTARRIYLLAEAPDPDAEMREALREALDESRDVVDFMALLRSHGFDIVRKDGAS